MTGTDFMDPMDPRERKNDLPEASSIHHYKGYTEVLLLDLLRSQKLSQEEYDVMSSKYKETNTTIH